MAEHDIIGLTVICEEQAIYTLIWCY